MKLVPVIVKVVPTGPLAGVNEVIVGMGGETMLRKIETLLLFWFVTAKSGFPSPSRSPMAKPKGSTNAKPKGFDPVVKSILAAKEPDVISPVALVFLNTETEVVFDTAKSGFPSPSMSPMATLRRFEPVAKSTLAAKEPAVIAPVALVFLNTETVLLLLFVTTKSGFPSPSKSPMATVCGFVPAEKLTLPAKEPDVISPMVLVFLNTETVALL